MTDTVRIRRRNRRTKYPWADLDVGDQLEVAVGEHETPRQVAQRVSAAGRQWCRRNAPERRFSVRAGGDLVRARRVE